MLFDNQKYKKKKELLMGTNAHFGGGGKSKTKRF